MISVLGAEKLSLMEIEALLTVSESVRFVGHDQREIYGGVQGLLCQQEYFRQGRRIKNFSGQLLSTVNRQPGILVIVLQLHLMDFP